MAMAYTTVWEVRPGAGSPNGGGGFNPANDNLYEGGSDFSQQDSPQLSISDLAIDANDASIVSSSGAPFLDNVHEGNVLNITAGTGFTVGRYEVVNVDVEGNATLDRACGTAGSTGGTAYLGGALNSVATAAGLAVAGNTVWVRSGTETLSAAAIFANAGEIGRPIRYRGYGSVRGDLEPAGRGETGPLVTDDFPEIAVQTYYLSLKEWTILECLKISGNRGGYLVTAGGFRTVLKQCALVNVNTGTSAACLSNGSNTTAIDCDFSNAGGAGSACCDAGRTICCRLTNPNGHGISGSTSYTSIGCVFHNLGGNAINTSSTATIVLAANCTFVNVAGACVSAGSGTHTGTQFIVINPQWTGCGALMNNPSATTPAIAGMVFHGRRRNTTSTFVGFGGWPMDWGEIATAQQDSEEYVDAAAGDYRLTSAAAGKGQGWLPHMDTGALQRAEPAGAGVIVVED